MVRLAWRPTGGREYQHGLAQGVIYPPNGPAFPWSGLRSVSEKLVVGNTQSFYQDGVKSHQTPAPADFQAKMKGLNNPRQLAALTGRPGDGKGLLIDNQPPVAFGLSYVTKVGNEFTGDFATRVHLIPSLIAVRKGFTNETSSDDNDPMEFEWDLVSQRVDGYRRSAYLFQSNRTTPGTFNYLLDLIHGTDVTPALMPLPEEMSVIETGVTLS